MKASKKEKYSKGCNVKMLSYPGWITGSTAMGIVVFSCSSGLYFIYKSKKSKAKLLSYAGLMVIFGGLCFLGAFCDFLTILLSGSNLDNSYGLLGILGGMWIIPGLFTAIYFGVELLIPEKKMYILPIYFVLGIIYELFIFLDPMGSHYFIPPTTLGEDLIEDVFEVGSPAGILFVIFMLSMLILNGFGFLLKSFQSTGIIRKKFLLLSIGIFLFLIFGAVDALIAPGIILIFVRFGYVSGFWFFYLGLREESTEPKRKRPKKEIKVESSLFRLTTRPTQITEEEVTFHREKKICLVCKGKVGGFNTYICTNCNVLYCETCARTLANLENMCWVCDSVIDPSKPVKLYEKEKGEEIKVSKEVPEKPEILDVPPKK